jgi:hypothetical protein
MSPSVAFNASVTNRSVTADNPFGNAADRGFLCPAANNWSTASWSSTESRPTRNTSARCAR